MTTTKGEGAKMDDFDNLDLWEDEYQVLDFYGEDVYADAWALYSAGFGVDEDYA